MTNEQEMHFPMSTFVYEKKFNMLLPKPETVGSEMLKVFQLSNFESIVVHSNNSDRKVVFARSRPPEWLPLPIESYTPMFWAGNDLDLTKAVDDPYDPREPHERQSYLSLFFSYVFALGPNTNSHPYSAIWRHSTRINPPMAYLNRTTHSANNVIHGVIVGGTSATNIPGLLSPKGP